MFSSTDSCIASDWYFYYRKHGTLWTVGRSPVDMQIIPAFRVLPVGGIPSNDMSHVALGEGRSISLLITGMRTRWRPKNSRGLQLGVVVLPPQAVKV